MPIDLKMEQCNLVCIFKNFDKAQVDFRQLVNLFSDEMPEVIYKKDVGTPSEVSFDKRKLKITYLGDRLQVQSDAPETEEATKNFAKYAIKVLDSSGNQSLSSFGLNYHFVSETGESIKTALGIQVNPANFAPQDAAFVRLVFLKDDIKYLIDFSEGKPLKIHVNAHYDTEKTTEDLSSEVKTLFNNSLADAKELIEEVLGNGRSR